MNPKVLAKDKEAMDKLYSKIIREKPADVFKDRLAIEEFVIDFAPVKTELGFILPEKFDWTIVARDDIILLVPLKKEN